MNAPRTPRQDALAAIADLLPTFCHKLMSLVIHDVMLGDHLLFNRADAIERLWEISQPLLADPPLPHEYSKGSWGPGEATSLVSPYSWHLPQS